jgi:hypothetical protein
VSPFTGLVVCGPGRGQVIAASGSRLEYAEGPPGPSVWPADPDAPVQGTTVTLVGSEAWVADRVFRVWIDPAHPDAAAEVVSALIDAHPETVRTVEVTPR